MCFLTESSKSPASIAQSNKQWVGTCLYQEWCKPLLISCEAAFGYEQVAKRIANIRLTNSEYRFGYWSYCKLDIEEVFNEQKMSLFVNFQLTKKNEEDSL